MAAGVDPFGVAVSPDGGSVYVANAASDSVSQYDVGAGGALAPKSPATVAAGDVPFGVAVSPDGGSVYVANVSGDNVSQYDVGAGGALSPKSPATVAAGTPGRGGGQPGRRLEVCGSRSGTRVGTSRGRVSSPASWATRNRKRRLFRVLRTVCGEGGFVETQIPIKLSFQMAVATPKSASWHCSGVSFTEGTCEIPDRGFEVFGATGG